MKIAVRILAVWGCIATIPLVCLVCSYLDREGIVEFGSAPANYYHSTDLQTKSLPTWNITNAIPLSPDAAVRAALAYASAKHPEVTNWDVDGIHLDQPNGGGIWTYDMLCRNDGDGGCWRGVPISCCLGPPSPPSGEKAGMRGRSQSTERSNSRFLQSTYDIDLIDRQTGRYITEYPRVLMDGSIWKPTHQK